MAMQPKRVGVVGAGIIGLATALLLAEKGIAVTIVARDLPGDLTLGWASPWAGAILAAHPDGDAALQKKSLELWSSLQQRDRPSGLNSLLIKEYYDDRGSGSNIWYSTFFSDFEFLPQRELPDSARIGFQYTCQVVDPTVFLPWLYSELKRRGVSFIRQKVSTLQEARRLLDVEIIVNASGVGAAELAEDEQVHPVRGQTMLVNSDFDHAVLHQGSHYSYAIPRPDSGGVILGGVSQPRTTSTVVHQDTKVDILRRVNKVTGNAFALLDLNKDVVKDIVGFRPGRENGMRLERQGHVIHAYGAGSLGWMYSFGIADKICTLLLDQSPSAKL